MDNGMTQIGQISMTQVLENKIGISLPKLSSEIVKLVQIGDLATIKILPDAQGNLQSSLIIEGKTYKFPLENKMMEVLSEGQNVTEIPVKINAGGKLTIIKSTTDNILIKPSISIPPSNNSALKMVEIAPLEVKSFIEKTLQDLNAPQNIKEQLTSNISALKVSVETIGTTQTNEKVLLQPLYQLLQRAVTEPQNAEVIKQLLVEELNKLVGSEINASVSEQINDMTRIKTSLGETFFDSKIKLPLNENVVLNINDITPQYPTELKFLDELIKVVLPQKTLNIKPETIAGSPQLKPLATALEKLPQEITSYILNKLPIAQNNFFQNIYNLYQGAKSKDISKWLGTQTIKKITEEISQAPKVLQELQNFTTTMVKETPIWKIVEMPLFDGTQFSPLKIAVKKDPEQQKKENLQQNAGTRFIVETNFSKLGSFQFDGLSHVKDRRLDLIVRTSVPQADDFCNNLMNLYKKSLYDVNYTGTIKINCQETFINLLEYSSSYEGIYV